MVYRSYKQGYIPSGNKITHKIFNGDARVAWSQNFSQCVRKKSEHLVPPSLSAYDKINFYLLANLFVIDITVIIF
jgi:hypothetical protein